jgi:hypothetical protein
MKLSSDSPINITIGCSILYSPLKNDFIVYEIQENTLYKWRNMLTKPEKRPAGTGLLPFSMN